MFFTCENKNGSTKSKTNININNNKKQKQLEIHLQITNEKDVQPTNQKNYFVLPDDTEILSSASSSPPVDRVEEEDSEIIDMADLQQQQVLRISFPDFVSKKDFNRFEFLQQVPQTETSNNNNQNQATTMKLGIFDIEFPSFPVDIDTMLKSISFEQRQSPSPSSSSSTTTTMSGVPSEILSTTGLTMLPEERIRALFGRTLSSVFTRSTRNFSPSVRLDPFSLRKREGVIICYPYPRVLYASPSVLKQWKFSAKTNTHLREWSQIPAPATHSQIRSEVARKSMEKYLQSAKHKPLLTKQDLTCVVNLGLGVAQGQDGSIFEYHRRIFIILDKESAPETKYSRVHLQWVETESNESNNNDDDEPSLKIEEIQQDGSGKFSELENQAYWASQEEKILDEEFAKRGNESGKKRTSKF